MPQATSSVQIRSFKDLTVWQRAMDLAMEAYRLARRLPIEERFGLADQIRRSGASVPANIAEGAGRRHTGEYLRGVSVALGSLKELESHLLLGLRLQYFVGDDLDNSLRLIEETGKMLGGLSKSLRRKVSREP